MAVHHNCTDCQSADSEFEWSKSILCVDHGHHDLTDKIMMACHQAVIYRQAGSGGPQWVLARPEGALARRPKAPLAYYRRRCRCTIKWPAGFKTAIEHACLLSVHDIVYVHDIVGLASSWAARVLGLRRRLVSQAGSASRCRPLY